MLKFPRSESEFNKYLVREYFMCGTVDEVLRKHSYGLPISYANYQRILNKWGIVKTAGPNSKISEILDFLTKLVEKNVPFEYLYKNMPPSFKTSAATIYRILSYIKEGVTRRIATGLIITQSQSKKKILVGEDVSKPRIELGKPFGSVSIPMGFSRKIDTREEAILRVLQQEVFTEFAIEGKLPDIIPIRPKPFMFLDIADVRVEIFHIRLLKKFSKLGNFSSYKLTGFKYLDIEDTKKMEKERRKFRVGVFEAISGFRKYQGLLDRNLAFNPLQYKSSLNYFLANEQANPFE
ncbi:hypothetical protein A2129_01310 [Candidatus Woesebacteria bacterium GWC1_42_13]|uniref:Uncharacterized protein n=1 Tax=Candidatus Woesebacteria bacterium GWC1_42_13 TaxID=1802475 RepID=A0A1F7WTY6_9BACT|nr:MAG: hypothetical protein A2129_01310 [Candidatus Woesebacteria bacterium GWC1_42_13]